MKELKDKVRQLRRKKGWTQEELAREINVSLSTVQRWEKKGGRPTRLARRELVKLFQRVGIEVVDFYINRGSNETRVRKEPS